MRTARLAPTSPQNGDTGNGEAFGRMAGLADKVLAMTGTPFNGKASSLFNLEYHLNPRVRQKYYWGGAARLERKMRRSQLSQGVRWYHRKLDTAELGWQEPHEHNSRARGDAEARWVEDMGVLEGGEDAVPQYDKESGAYTGTVTYDRPYLEAPGISPLCVAEVLDHTIFFSLTDMSEALPDYQEIAIAVDLDEDVQKQHDQTQQRLKDYLTDQLWEGDSTFRGAYFHWCIDWQNSAFLDYDVIHNRRDKTTRAVSPSSVLKLDSMGTNRIYAKEQKLLEIVDEELAANRPCIIFCRQTDKRDIQKRLKQLIESQIPLAKAFILEAKVDPERREALIEKVVDQGHNIIIANPELVKTGLDLVFAGTLIFFEPIYNLGTMMQAAGRNYRLNQKRHKLCKVIYLYHNATMEATAIKLMSKKQRAAKILQGDTGLTGLEALTEGEGGLQEALLNEVGKNAELVDPSTLFKEYDETKIIDRDDLAFWNGALSASEPEPADDLLETAVTLGATITPLPSAAASPSLLADTFQPHNTTPLASGAAPLQRVAKPATSVRDAIRTALASCLPAGATTVQQLDHDAHISNLVNLFDRFVAETPIFWEDGNDQVLMRDLRKYLVTQQVAALLQAAELANAILAALKPAALNDAKTRLQQCSTSTTTRKPTATPLERLNAELAPAVERFRQRAPTHNREPPESFTQLSLFG